MYKVWTQFLGPKFYTCNLNTVCFFLGSNTKEWSVILSELEVTFIFYFSHFEFPSNNQQ
jgi:hypothetical protein